MKLQPIPERGRVLCRARSIRLIIVAGILSGCEVAFPILDQFVTILRGAHRSCDLWPLMSGFLDYLELAVYDAKRLKSSHRRCVGQNAGHGEP